MFPVHAHVPVDVQHTVDVHTGYLIREMGENCILGSDVKLNLITYLISTIM